ncbi:ECF-type sigma factor [Novipirellula artificiosorum]|uniref:ECF sigma factor n=1 Tax=Novipirellula artificiosorum TaxID=2528016 RepID=A0A5C6CDB8_9BACT|nr:ECF-type sigma factor [Novipirellula artificiosorum]TWU22853.1 ECF sigma factor [Novipirellula artificiosorum]
MSDVTRLLHEIEHGDPVASERLLPLVYDELRRLASYKLASEKSNMTLQATALVHEAYIRLVDTDRIQTWESRGHFFAAAAEAMRRILINRARDKGRLKRGGDRKRINLDAVTVAVTSDPADLLAFDQALEQLTDEDAVCAKLVKLRFFAGLTQGEAADALGIARRTADRYWAYARAWLYDYLDAT